MPPGAAWPRAAAAMLTRLLDALAAEFHRADARAANLVEEADPRTAHELLADWERMAGLPDECYPEANTLERRRRALVSRLTRPGGQSRRYFIGLAAALGYGVAVTEFTPHDVTATAAALFMAIGTTWGAGDGAATFNLPDLRRRVTIGAGGTGSDTIGNALGDTGGEEDHTLTVDEMPAHGHEFHSNADAAGGSTIHTMAGAANPAIDANQNPIANTGGSQPHNNMQPSAVVTKIIKT